jgi:hypothetical protein
MTGAPCPEARHAVVRSRTRKSRDLVKIFAPSPGRQHRSRRRGPRKRGSHPGEGELIGPAEVGMLAALGLASVGSSTGQALRHRDRGRDRGGRKNKPGRIWNSNGYSLSGWRRAPRRATSDRRDGPPGSNKIQGRDADILAISGAFRSGLRPRRERLRRPGVSPVFWRLRINREATFSASGRRSCSVFREIRRAPWSCSPLRPAAIDLMLGRNGPASQRQGRPRAEITVRPGRTQFPA